jgi:hypothetical protein
MISHTAECKSSFKPVQDGARAPGVSRGVVEPHRVERLPEATFDQVGEVAVRERCNRGSIAPEPLELLLIGQALLETKRDGVAVVEPALSHDSLCIQDACT